MDVTNCQSRGCGGALIPIDGFLKHVRDYHREEDLKFSCPLCEATNLQYNGLVSHWYRHHPKRPKPLKMPKVPSELSQTGRNGSESAEDQNINEAGRSGLAISSSQESPSVPSAVSPPHGAEESATSSPQESPSVTSAVSPPCSAEEIAISIPPDSPSGPSAVSPPHSAEESATSSPQDSSRGPSAVSPPCSAEENIMDITSDGSDELAREVGRDLFRDAEVSSDEEGNDLDHYVDSGDDKEADVGIGTGHESEELSEGTKRGLDFLLTMKTVCGVNKTQLKTVVKETSELIEYVFTSTIEKLTEAGCSVETVNVDKVKSDVCGIFGDFKSRHLQEKHFMQQYNVIKPKCVTVDRELRRAGTGKKRKTVIAQKNFYYVSIIEALDRLLQHPDYEKMTQRSVDSNPDILDCYLKGELAKMNPVLQRHPDALRIILYYDDVEMCSGLSSRASGMQKLGAFYMTLDNIHPKHRSSLKTICLVALANAAYFKTPEGADFVSNRIIQDLEALENGVVIRGRTMYATLIAYIGDNLAIHLITGLKCCFIAHRMCRTCKVTLEEARSQVKEDPEMLRTVAEHNKQVEEIEKATTLKERDRLSTEYGINKSCPFNQRLVSYHSVNGTPPDLMHDQLEGTLSRNVKNLVKYCVEDVNIVTLSWLNEALRDFDYGYTESSSKPSVIKADHLKEGGNLRQSSSQTWTLAFTLPLILGSHIDENNPHWKNYILLLEIFRKCFSDSINKNLIPYLSDMIQTFLTGYKALYGNLLPKDHFMVHYPRCWLLYGTLIDFICMRMEANHKILKKQVYGLGNYKNIPKSLAMTYQLCQAFEWSKPLIRETTYGVLKRLKICQLPYGKLLSGCEEVVEASWVDTEGFLFKKEGCYICLGDDEYGRPTFACVVNIVVWPQLFFVCHAVETEYYHTHLSAYKISDTEKFEFHQVTDVKGKRVFHGHYVGKDKFIVLRECVGKSF